VIDVADWTSSSRLKFCIKTSESIDDVWGGESGGLKKLSSR